MFKRLFRRLFFNSISTHEIREILERESIISCERNSLKEDSSRFYAQASVNNFQHKRDSISIGSDSHIRGTLQVFAYGGSIRIGNYCYIGENSHIWSGDKIEIGNNVLISHQVNIIDSNSHEINAFERAEGYKHILTKGHPKEKGSILTAPILIKDNVWISFGCIILKGVTIGEGAVVAAGSVVIKDVAPYSLVAGNPARFIKDLPR
jgi:acetyltransferase-like isoleucine patch superfamily enzyme